MIKSLIAVCIGCLFHVFPSIAVGQDVELEFLSVKPCHSMIPEKNPIMIIDTNRRNDIIASIHLWMHHKIVCADYGIQIQSLTNQIRTLEDMIRDAGNRH